MKAVHRILGAPIPRNPETPKAKLSQSTGCPRALPLSSTRKRRAPCLVVAHSHTKGVPVDSQLKLPTSPGIKNVQCANCLTDLTHPRNRARALRCSPRRRNVAKEFLGRRRSFSINLCAFLETHASPPAWQVSACADCPYQPCSVLRT